MNEKIKRVWLEVQVFMKGSSVADSFEDVYFVKETNETLTLYNHYDEKLWQETIPMKEIAFYRISQEIEYCEERQD